MRKAINIIKIVIMAVVIISAIGTALGMLAVAWLVR